MKRRIFVLGMFLIAAFAISVGTASADLQLPDLVIPSRDIVDISVEEHGSTLISNVECQIDFDGYFRDGPFDVYFLPPKNAENIVVKANNQLKTYHYLLNASEYINSNVKVPSEYIDDYTVIAWTVGEDFVPTRDDEDYMPINISVTYSHRLVGSILPGQAYTLKYALIPLGYKELNVSITLPVSTNPDTIICKPKQLQLSYNDSGTYLHLNENNSDYRVPFGDVEVCFSTHTASPIYVPDNSIYVPKNPIYVPDDFATIQDAVDAAYLNDTIIVRDGTYIENVDVYKRLTIRSENGSDSTIVRAANSSNSVFEVNADYVNLSGFSVEGGYGYYGGGIYLYDAEYCTISNNNCTKNSCGIYLSSRFGDSDNNSITNNICSNNDVGIRVDSNNSITNNICSNNDVGIRVGSNNSITNNICSNNDVGIRVGSNNSITNNTCSTNVYASIHISGSNNKLKSNVMVDNGILWVFGNDVDTSNTVNGKPVYYWANVNGGTVPEGAGQVILLNCSNVIIENQYLNNACIGIQIALSSNITVKNNTCSSNSKCGIFLLWDSNNNSITNNTCIANNIHSNRYHGDGISLRGSNNSIANNTCSNNRYGIALDHSNNNSIYLNNFINNTNNIHFFDSNNNSIYLNNFINNANNVHSYESTNLWRSDENVTYTYNETRYTNYLGNYWDDYTETDADGEGIGDTPYPINSDKDNYPLMQPWENYLIEENGTNTKDENQKLAFSYYYQPIKISVNASVPPYPLPLNLSTITNIEDITAKLGLNETEEELLETNGFVILDYGQEDDIVAPYDDLKIMGIPIFVTTDTLLHLYHIQFNEILKGIEEREFFDVLLDMSNAMLEQSIQDHENFDDPELKESARRNVAYFAVALKLLQTPTEGYNGSEDIKQINFSIPDYVIEDVNNEIANIAQHEGFHPSAIFNSNQSCICDYPCCYCEDYSQYVPRGHYTRSEQLKRYFKAMMWYGRIAFMLKGCSGDEALISNEDANLSTIQAALIASELPDVAVNNTTAQEIWDRIYTVTAFFVGTADDLTPYEYRDAQNVVFGTAYNASDLSDENKLLELKVELAKLRSPEIYGGSGVCVVYPPITEAKLYECLNETKGMRFMGQRFVPDSYMFQQLVSPAVGIYVGNGTPFTMCYTGAGPARCFPRGLDIMTVLGSERAADILIEDGDTEYAGLNLNTSYEKQLNELKSEFAGFNTSGWNRNLYWSWLYMLKPLLTEFDDGYPTFMQTKAWRNKALQSSLASWTELRHDTILYGKQSYTPSLKGMPSEPKPVVGYVEPVPEFYARLLALTEMTEKGLVGLDVLNETEKGRLQNLEGILERLMNISVAELENKELTNNDYKFIMDFGANLDYVVTGVNAKGKETTIVADVHTDCNTGMVLEEGVGYVDLILVAYIVPDGRIIVGGGPVFSYYEFKHPMDDRLTDEKWKEMLGSDLPPEKPGWVDGIGG